MEQHLKQSPALMRLAVCIVAAAALYAALDRFGERIPQLSPHMPWLAEHKVQTIALMAAVLFGAGLALFPLEAAPAVSPPEEAEPGPFDGYERGCGGEDPQFA